MLKGVSDLFYLNGVGEDIFGETYSAQIARRDPVNKHLFYKMMKEYI